MRIVRILRDPTAEWWAKWFPMCLGECRPNPPWVSVAAEEWHARGVRFHC